MTQDEQIADLQARLKVFEDFFTFGTSVDGLVPYVKTAGRVGVMSIFWAEKPVGQGAALSAGTAIDRYAIYGEIDAITCPNHPSTAIYGSVVAPNPTQKNLAFEAHAENAPNGNIGYYCDVQYSPNAPDKLTPIVVGEMVDDVVTRTRVFGFE